jgi:hypothetical protein
MLAQSIQRGPEPAFDTPTAPGQADAFTPAEEPVPGYLDQDVSRFFYRWGGHLSATLVRIRSRFDGDLDQYLLYLIFLLSELSQTMASTAPDRAFARRGLNALSLSDITQIPRETARRKLLALAERGYLVRAEDGLFVLGDLYGLDEFFTDLKPLFWDAVKVAPGR